MLIGLLALEFLELSQSVSMILIFAGILIHFQSKCIYRAFLTYDCL